MALFAASLAWLPQGKMILVLVALWGAGWGLSHLGLSTFLTNLPDALLRDASGLNSALRFVAGGIGAFLGGKSIEALGFKAHFAVLFLAMSALALAMIKINRRNV